MVSTRLGAEGITEQNNDICELADEPAAFARSVIHLLRNAEYRHALATRARQYVETQRDIRTMTERLVECYGEEVQKKATSLRP